MPSVEGLGARRARCSMLDAVLRRGQTLDAAGAGRARPAAGRPGAGAGDRRRDAAPPARSRRADRQRDPPARCPTTARRGWCCASRWPRRSASARPTMRWSRPRCRWSTAARAAGPRRARHAAAPRPAADRRAAPARRSSSAGARPGAKRSSMPPAARSPAPAARPQLRRRCEAQAYAPRTAARSLAPRHVRLESSRSPNLPASARAAGGSRTSPPRFPRG
jgi:hypothetical protein